MQNEHDITSQILFRTSLEAIQRTLVTLNKRLVNGILYLETIINRHVVYLTFKPLWQSNAIEF